MTKRGKRWRSLCKKYDLRKLYGVEEAIAVLQEGSGVGFDETVEFSVKLGVDPKKSDQQVRSTLILPFGTGKKVRIVVLTRDPVKIAQMEALAIESGGDDLVGKIQGGWLDFDVLVATPDMMRDVGRLGKLLGPRGLMPTPKAGTVTSNPQKAVEELQKGKVEFKVDKSGVIHNIVGKISFSKEQLCGNLEALVGAINRAKPATAKGVFLVSASLSSTMGVGLKIDIGSIAV